MYLFLILSAIFPAALFGYQRKNEAKHRARLDRVQYHVHVNGIRGKSTVTRMLGGMLSGANIATVAKTTGTYACVIDPSAEEHPIQRTGPANIAEQYSFIRNWVDADVDGLVVECMAVKPKYQKICQDTILRSPISVITNVRLDHQEDLGDTLEEIAVSLCNTVPQNGVLVTGERKPELVAIMRREAEKRGSRFIVAEETELSRSLVKKFSYQQFEENVAVALAVADVMGLSQHDAIKGMLQAQPDPGTTAVEQIPTHHVDTFTWVPMFAINDWESTIKVFRTVSEDFTEDCSRVVILNNRSDRTDRAQLFIDLVTTELSQEIDRVVLMGDLQEVVEQQLAKSDFAGDVITTADVEATNGQALMERIVDGIEGDVAVFGMVNIHTDNATALREFFTELVQEEEVVNGIARRSGNGSDADAAADSRNSTTSELVGTASHR